MTSSLRYAIVALCAALALSACTKSSDTSTLTDTSATAGPDAAQTAAAATDTGAPVATGNGAPAASETTGTSGAGASTGYIDLPVYPGSTEDKNQGLSMSASGNSVLIKIYQTKDDGGKVATWYKSNLPSAWKNSIVTSENKTAATFVNEMNDGSQTVLITTQDGATTRILLSTKHGK